MKRITKLWPWLAAICSGLLYAACFAPFNLTWFCWIALTPLIAAIWFSGAESRHPWLRNLLLGYVAGLTFFWIVFFWLTTVTVLGWFVLAFYMAIYFAIWAWFCGLLRPRAGKRQSPGASKWDQMLAQARTTAAPAPSPWTKSTNNLRLAFILAAAWTTFEWLRGWVFSGFGWNGLGVALHDYWPLIQITELTGVAGLSFVVAFANVIVLTTAYRLVVEARTRVMRPHFDFTVTMAAIVGVLIFGLRATQISPPTKPLRVAAVQSNVPQTQKFDPQFTRRIFDQFRRLSEIALRSNPPPDLLVWPESSMPGPVLADQESYKFVMDLAASADTDLLLGTIDVDKQRRLQRGAACFRWRRTRAGISEDPPGTFWRIRSRSPYSAAACADCRRSGTRRFQRRKRTHRVHSDQQRGPCGAVDLFRRHDWRAHQTICPSKRDKSRREPARRCDERRLVSEVRWIASAPGECNLSLRRNASANDSRGEYRRDLFHQPIWPRHSNAPG